MSAVNQVDISIGGNISNVQLNYSNPFSNGFNSHQRPEFQVSSNDASAVNISNQLNQLTHGHLMPPDVRLGSENFYTLRNQQLSRALQSGKLTIQHSAPLTVPTTDGQHITLLFDNPNQPGFKPPGQAIRQGYDTPAMRASIPRISPAGIATISGTRSGDAATPLDASTNPLELEGRTTAAPWIQLPNGCIVENPWYANSFYLHSGSNNTLTAEYSDSETTNVQHLDCN